MNGYSIIELFPNFLLIFVRLTSFFVVAPFFSARNIPQTTKIGLSFFLSLITFTYIGMKPVPFDYQFVTLILKEMFIGLALGFIGMMMLYAVQIAGSFVDMQLGLSMASVIDPSSGVNGPITGQFKYALAILFLLSVDAHHLLIKGIVESYKLVPIEQLSIHLGTGNFIPVLTQAFYQMFTSSFLIAAPVAAALFLVDVALGIVAKTVPQMNIFVVGVPIKIIAGFILLIVVLPGYFFSLKKLFGSLFQSMEALLKALGVS